MNTGQHRDPLRDKLLDDASPTALVTGRISPCAIDTYGQLHSPAQDDGRSSQFDTAHALADTSREDIFAVTASHSGTDLVRDDMVVSDYRCQAAVQTKDNGTIVTTNTVKDVQSDIEPGQERQRDDGTPREADGSEADEGRGLPVDAAHNVSASHILSDRDPDVMKSAEPSEEISLGKEISSREVRPAAEYFEIENNTSPDFAVKLRSAGSKSWTNPKAWCSLQCLDRVHWNGYFYQNGDLIYARTGSTPNAIDVFEIAEIRSLGDGRSIIRGFWYYHRSHLVGWMGKTSLRLWPTTHTHIKSTHTEIMMWDCASGHLSKDDRELMAFDLICDMATNVWIIKRRTDTSVTWTESTSSSRCVDAGGDHLI